MYFFGIDHDFKHTGFGGILGLCASRKLPVFVIFGNVYRNGGRPGNTCACIFGRGVCHEFIHTVRSFKIQRNMGVTVCAVIAVSRVERHICRVAVYAVIRRKLAVGHCGAVFIGIFFQIIFKEQAGARVFFAKRYIGVAFFQFELGNKLIFISLAAICATLNLYALKVVCGRVYVSPICFRVGVVFVIRIHGVFNLFNFERIHNGFIGSAVGGDTERIFINLHVGKGYFVLQVKSDMRKLVCAQKRVMLGAGGSTAGKIKNTCGVCNACCFSLGNVCRKPVYHISAGVNVLVAGKYYVDIKLLHNGGKLLSAFLYLFVYKITI